MSALPNTPASHAGQAPSLVGGPLSDDLQRMLMDGVGVLFQSNPFWAAFAMSPKLTLGRTSAFAEALGVTTAATDCNATVAFYEPFLRRVIADAQKAGIRSAPAGIVTYIALHELAHILMDDANELTNMHMPNAELRAQAVDYRVFELLRADGFSPPAAFQPFTLQDFQQAAAGQKFKPEAGRTPVVGDPDIAKRIPNHGDVVEIYRWLEQQQNVRPNGGAAAPKLALSGDALDASVLGAQSPDPQPGTGGASSPGLPNPMPPLPSGLRQEILAEATASANMMGNMSVAARRVAEALFRPTVAWEQQLRNLVRSAANSGPRARSYRRLGRQTFTGYQQEQMRSPGRTATVAYPSYLPGPAAKIVAAIDTSGSIDDDTLTAFAAELSGILSSKCVSEVHVVYCAAETADGEVFRPGDKAKLVSPITGGTDFEPVWHWQRKNVPDAACIVYLTDMYGSFGPRNTWPKCPVIWAKTTDVHPPFGKSVRIKLGR